MSLKAGTTKKSFNHLLTSLRRHSLHPQQRCQVPPGKAPGVLRYLFRRAFGDDFAALDAAFRSHVDDPVGGLNDIQIMLDHDHAVALFDQGVEDFEQFADVFEVEAGGGLVQYVEGLAGGSAGEFLGEFDALGFAAGEGGGLLADLYVAEADFGEHRHLVADGGDGLEEFHRVLDGHVEHVGDAVALELHLQRFAIVARAVADVAGDIDVGEEVHLDLEHAVALAGFAAAALDVEAEAAGLVAARLRFGEAREPVADVGEGAGVGGRVGAGGAADGRLVDVDHLVAMFEAGDLVVGASDYARAVQLARGRCVEGVDGEAGLA